MAAKEIPGAAGDPKQHRPVGGSVVAQVQGVLADRIVVSTPLDPFLDLKALAEYSSLCVRKLRDRLDDASHPLPYYRVGGKIVVRRSEFDNWMAAYRHHKGRDVDAIVSDVLRTL